MKVFGEVAKRSNATGCKPVGPRPSKVRILLSPPASIVSDIDEGDSKAVARGCSSVGRASAFHAECRGFESRRPLQAGATAGRLLIRGYMNPWSHPRSRVSKLKSGLQPDFTSGTSLRSVSNLCARSRWSNSLAAVAHSTLSEKGESRGCERYGKRTNAPATTSLLGSHVLMRKHFARLIGSSDMKARWTKELVKVPSPRLMPAGLWVIRGRACRPS